MSTEKERSRFSALVSRLEFANLKRFMEITTHLKGYVPILEPHGKVVGAEVSALREKLVLWLDDAQPSYLLIDFTWIRKIDSSALGMLVNMHVNAERQGTRIGLINVGKHIRNLLVLTRLVNVFRCFGSVDAAISALGPQVIWRNSIRKKPLS